MIFNENNNYEVDEVNLETYLDCFPVLWRFFSKSELIWLLRKKNYDKNSQNILKVIENETINTKKLISFSKNSNTEEYMIHIIDTFIDEIDSEIAEEIFINLFKSSYSSIAMSIFTDKFPYLSFNSLDKISLCIKNNKKLIYEFETCLFVEKDKKLEISLTQDQKQKIIHLFYTLTSKIEILIEFVINNYNFLKPYSEEFIIKLCSDKGNGKYLISQICGSKYINDISFNDLNEIISNLINNKKFDYLRYINNLISFFNNNFKLVENIEIFRKIFLSIDYIEKSNFLENIFSDNYKISFELKNEISNEFYNLSDFGKFIYDYCSIKNLNEFFNRNINYINTDIYNYLELDLLKILNTYNFKILIELIYYLKSNSSRIFCIIRNNLKNIPNNQVNEIFDIIFKTEFMVDSYNSYSNEEKIASIFAEYFQEFDDEIINNYLKIFSTKCLEEIMLKQFNNIELTIKNILIHKIIKNSNNDNFFIDFSNNYLNNLNNKEKELVINRILNSARLNKTKKTIFLINNYYFLKEHISNEKNYYFFYDIQNMQKIKSFLKQNFNKISDEIKYKLVKIYYELDIEKDFLFSLFVDNYNFLNFGDLKSYFISKIDKETIENNISYSFKLIIRNFNEIELSIKNMIIISLKENKKYDYLDKITRKYGLNCLY